MRMHMCTCAKGLIYPEAEWELLTVSGRRGGSEMFLRGSATSEILREGHRGTREFCLPQLNSSQHVMRGVPLLSQYCFMIARLSFTVIFAPVTHLFLPFLLLLYFFFFHELTSHC